MSIDVNVQNDLVIVTETTEDIVVNVSNAAGPQGPAGAAGVGVPVGGSTGQVLKKFSATNYDTYWAEDASGLTSVGLSVPTGLTVTNSPLTTNGTIAVGLASGYSIPTTASQATWDAAYNDSIVSAAVTGTTTKTLTLTQQDAGTITATWSDLNTDAVTSVFGRTGAVVATGGDYTTSQVTEVTNLYYTEGRVSANTDVAANTAARHNAVTLGTANGLTLSTQALSLGLSSASTTGALSSTDWTTFNSKQIALNGTGFVKISGTTISYDNSTYYLASNPNAFIALTALSAGTGISYNNTTGVITNASPDQVVALTASTGISISGTYPNFTITNTSQSSGGTVTSVGLSSATSGVTIGSTPITTSGTITLAIATASGSQNGLLSSTDWTTFNGKQNAITLTTTGTSGAATLIGATLNIPQYADQFVGTVTSVAALTIGTTGTDLSSTVANGTTTPVITLNVPTASATNRGALSSADWTTFNNKVDGSGTINYLPKFTASSTLGNSLIYESSGVVNVGGQINITTGQALTLGLQNLQLPTGVASTISAGLSVRTGVANESIIQFGNNLNAYYTGLVDASKAGAMIRLDTRGVAPIPGASSYSVFQIQTRAAGVADPNYTVPVQIAAAPSGSFCIDINGYGYFYNRLRIGNTTTAPTEALSVTGNGVFSSNVTAASLIKSGGTSSQFLKADGSVDSTTYQPLLTNPVTGTGTTNYLPKWTSGSAIGNSLVYDDGTNVGINTLTANRRLTIGGTANAYMSFNASSNRNTTIGSDGFGNFIVYDDTGSDYRLCITSGGNLLVGTTTDSGEKLQVNGTGRFTGALEINNNALTQDGTRPIITLKQSGTSKLLLGISSVADDIIVGAADGDIDFRTNSQAFNFSVNNGGSIAFKLASNAAATFSSSVTATSFIKTGGTSSQYLMADGSVTTGGGGSVDELQVSLICQVFG